MLLDIVWSEQDFWNFGSYLETMGSNPKIAEQKDERNMNA